MHPCAKAAAVSRFIKGPFHGGVVCPDCGQPLRARAKVGFSVHTGSARTGKSRERPRNSGGIPRPVPECTGLVLCRRNRDVPVPDAAVMVTLEVNWTGVGFVAVDGAAGYAGDLLIVDGGHVVEYHRRPSPDDGDVISLPLRPERRRSGWAKHAIDGAYAGERVSVAATHARTGSLLARRCGLPRRVQRRLNLYFVPAAKVDSAILAGRADEFDMQLEIGKSPLGPEIGSLRFVGKFSVLDRPVAFAGVVQEVGSVIDRLPAGEILAIEQRFRSSRRFTPRRFQ